MWCSSNTLCVIHATNIPMVDAMSKHSALLQCACFHPNHCDHYLSRCILSCGAHRESDFGRGRRASPVPSRDHSPTEPPWDGLHETILSALSVHLVTTHHMAPGAANNETEAKFGVHSQRNVSRFAKQASALVIATITAKITMVSESAHSTASPHWIDRATVVRM